MDISHSLENGIDQRVQKRNGLRQLVRKGVFVTQEMSEYKYLAQLLSSQTFEGFFVSQILVMAVKLDLRQSGFNMKFFEKTDKQFVFYFSSQSVASRLIWTECCNENVYHFHY